MRVGSVLRQNQYNKQSQDFGAAYQKRAIGVGVRKTVKSKKILAERSVEDLQNDLRKTIENVRAQAMRKGKKDADVFMKIYLNTFIESLRKNMSDLNAMLADVVRG